MPNALKNVVESGATTLSDLVDDARSMIEDLPPLAHARHKKARKNWTPVVVLVLVAFVAVFAAKQLRHPSPTTAESTSL
ncbi:MAG TPA: hypothetical protein VHQ23_11020 [Ilumatobacteraceae bacterium]|jgi:hypothetical protein|nr:hypothetical protein [Ilumatobacteraceae bacterium]